MKRSWSIITVLLVVAVLFGAVFAPAVAAQEKPPANECKTFYLLAAHGINGERLGLDRELPVDVYVNGGYAFTFEFKDVQTAELPAGKYWISVNLAGTDVEVMNLGTEDEPLEIPGCVKVRVVAKLVDGVPTLLPKITELARK